ncbi:(2Fe-2S)-binding protein [Mesorhizobium sp. BAC0120]|uniref:(2Fe-2S)-binding protein n=1 Tax=Mesorhizobium sp. BAC0120 TaxID=3090670 RepID=UPI00298BDA21|nr:(2Fe-2S)-binding protein [Mesorhizobium sp. BAC0120]MDW6023217.1 (2Fe-2S)-binding protein [Mesorhizobium sp. BAC0120]
MSRFVKVLVNGEIVMAQAGVSLGSVLHGRSPALRHSPVELQPRGLYCGMGVCFECLVMVDGRPERACITPVREGMAVEVQP